MLLIELLVWLFYGYLLVGAVFGIYFVIGGAARIDPDAHDMPVSLRLLLWPGSVALWPILSWKVWQSRFTQATRAVEESSLTKPA